MTLPKMKPTPTPGPMVPRPAPMPSAIALPALRPYSCAVSGSTACARVVTSLMTDRSTVLVSLLVLLGDCAAEVDRGKGGEDEGLKRCDQAHLEEEEGHGHRAGDEAEDDRAADRQVQEDDEAAAHEQDQQVPGEDVREKTNGEADEPDEVGDDLDQEDREGRRALDAGGDPGLQVADGALGPDALDVVAEPHEQREDERHRDVGRGGEQREARDLEAEDVDLVLRVGRQRQVAEQVREPDEQEERPDEREPLRGHLGVHVAARDVVAHEQEHRLDRRLDAVGTVRHPLGDVDHRPAHERRGDEHVEDGLVDGHDPEVDPRVELELVLRAVALVDVDRERARRGDQQGDERHQEDGEALGHHEGSSRWFSNGRRMRFTVKYAVKSTTTSTAAASPTASSLPAIRYAPKIVSATSHPRPIIEPAVRPTTVLGSSDAAARRARTSLMTRCTIQANAAAA